MSAAPGGARLLVRGPIGALDGELYDMDANGAHLVSFGTPGASPLEWVDFAATWDGGAPAAIARRYTTDGRLTLSFLRGPASAGDAWSEARVDVSAPPLTRDQAPVEAQPLAIVREANGDLVAFDVAGGLAMLSAAGKLSQPAVVLPHVPRSVTALVVDGAAVFYVLTDMPQAAVADAGVGEGGGTEGDMEAGASTLEGGADGGAMDAGDAGNPRRGAVTDLDLHYIDRITHTAAGFIVDSLGPFNGTSTQSMDLANDQIAAIDSQHLVTFMSTIGDGDYTLFLIAPDATGTLKSNPICTNERCDNSTQWRGYSRLAVAPTGAVATNGGFPQGDPSANDNGLLTVLDVSSTPPRMSAAGSESSRVDHPCETVK
jgi:hypothetical protein